MAILVSAPEVDESKTINPERDFIAIKEAEQLKYDWIAFDLSAPISAEGYAFNAGKTLVSKSLGAKMSKRSGKERVTDIPSWAKGQKPLPRENGKAFVDRLLREQGFETFDKGPTSDFNKLKKYGDKH